MATTTSSYLKYLPAVLWSGQPAPSAFGLGTALCVFEKILTGIDDGFAITHGDNSVMTTVTQAISGSPSPQTIYVTAGAGSRFQVGSSYTYNGDVAEVINVTGATLNTITAVVRQNHPAFQTIVNSSGLHRDIQDVIANLVSLYGAWTTPSGYLDWLAQWVSLQMDPAWDEYQRRLVLSKIVKIYGKRGTKPGLDTYFDIYGLARQRPRVVVDNHSKILFCTPAPGKMAPISTLVSQQPLVAPQCMAMDENGYLLVADLGSSDSVIKPALWRISTSGQYDYCAGPPPAPQPYQPAGVNLQAPVAVAVDSVHGGAYLIDLLGPSNYWLYRFTGPQTGTITLTGTPTPGETSVITVDGVAYSSPETGGPTLAQEAAATGVALDVTAPFQAKYVAVSSGPNIAISPLSGEPQNDLTFVTSYGKLILTAAPTAVSGWTITVSGAPTTGESCTVTVLADALPTVSITAPETTGHTLAQQASTIAAALNGNASFTVNYTATVSGAVVTISPHAGVTANDLRVVTATSSLQLTATGPSYSSSTVFANNASAPPLGLKYPTAMVIDGTGRPIILDRGAAPPAQSKTVIVEVPIAGVPPTYHGPAAVNAFPTIAEPLSLLLRADGSLLVGDGGYQSSAAPADIVSIDTNTWQSTSLLGAMPSGANPLVAPTGIVEVDAQHLLVVDAGLRPFVPAAGSPFISITAQQGAVYRIDLSVAPPTISRVTELKGLVYPRAMVGDGNGPVYICNSGLPQLTGYNSRKWRSGAQQLSAVVQFQGRPEAAIYSIFLSGTPTNGEQCSLSAGAMNIVLLESAGTVGQQATAWAATLNATASFNALYIALAVGAGLFIYGAAGASAAGAAFTTTSSANLTLTNGLLAMAVSLSGTPTSGEFCVVNVGGFAYLQPSGLPETTGNSTTVQAASWAAALNSATPFNIDYNAVAAGNSILIFYKSQTASSNLPSFVTSSPHLTLTAAQAPSFVGTVALSGSSTAGESCTLSLAVGLLPPNTFTLNESNGQSAAAQAAAWCSVLNMTPAFSASFLATSSGAVINLFTTTAVGPSGIAISVTSSEHLSLIAYSELQNRNRFLQSITDVLSDEIPAHARWRVQSEQFQV